MTFSEFLEKIEEHRIEFHIRERGGPDYNLYMIRDEQGRCPICALAYRVTGNFYLNSSYRAAAKELGLSDELMNEIVAAADDDPRPPYTMTPEYRAIRALVRE